jgi:F0F1-type ATP synthase assembly protein I
MKDKEWWSNIFYLSEIGLIIIVSILLGLGVGLFLDRKLNTSFFIFIFLIFGIVGGFLGVYKIIFKNERFKE